jgi:hypothetical protein
MTKGEIRLMIGGAVLVCSIGERKRVEDQSSFGDDFFAQELRPSLIHLSPSHWAAFAAACSERLLPAYEVFAGVSGWGDPGQLRHALSYAWDSIEQAERWEPLSRRLRALADESMTVLPDTEEWPSAIAAAARNAGSAVSYTLEIILERDFTAVKYVSFAIIETLGWYADIRCAKSQGIWYTEPPRIISEAERDRLYKECEEMVATDPFVVAEKSYQSEDAQWLARKPRLSAPILTELRQASAARTPRDVYRGLVEIED